MKLEVTMSNEEGQSRLTVGLGIADRLREWIPDGDGYNSEYARCLSEAADEIDTQQYRADVLAAVIRDLVNVVTHGAETKDEFIKRVRDILSSDPDVRAPNGKSEGRGHGKEL